MAATEPRRLTKGLEEEVYVGTSAGDVLPLSPRIAADLKGFHTEPDGRNVEYQTAPHRDYGALLDELMTMRCRLRRYLRTLGDYTPVPGSTLSLAENDAFYIADADNPYYRYIRDTYGHRVVTASTHINIGIADPDRLVAAYRVLRAEASMFLALTANSPFLRGRVTGAHSNRWLMFPETPERVPFFRGHAHFRQWVDEQLAAGTMFNPRHLWLSIRPNGDGTPERIDRLELRVCDRIAPPRLLGAVIAFFEARVWQVLEDPDLDPLRRHDESTLLELCRRNERRAAGESLDAVVTDWRTGDDVAMREWITDHLRACRSVARDRGFLDRLDPIAEILADGNLAQQWLAQVAAGRTPREVLQAAMRELAAIDQAYDPDCPCPGEGGTA